jgi:IMP and pyridine-specific 5'-nucleotidase
VGTDLRNALVAIERLLDEHRLTDGKGRLKKYCPDMGKVFLHLDLLGALDEYDAHSAISKRRFVPPSFREVRELLNLAVVHAIAPVVQLVTLDADDTLYEDGGVLTVASPVIPLITKLLRAGVQVAVVTAASYPGQPEKYAMRLGGLLTSLAFAISLGAPASIANRFHVVGGQCNYMMRTRVALDGDGLSPRVYFEEAAPHEWKGFRGVRWDHAEVARLLDVASEALTRTASLLGLDVLLIRKERAVGIVLNSTSPTAQSGRLTYEVLEEIALSVQYELDQHSFRVPHCTFNGGQDVFVDVGHKALGIASLQGLLNIPPEATVHAGDRFTRTGNDLRARVVANTLWVGGPAETEYLLALLIEDIRRHRAAGTAVAPAWTSAAPEAGAAAPPAVGAAAPPRLLPAAAAEAEEKCGSAHAQAAQPPRLSAEVIRTPLFNPMTGEPLLEEQDLSPFSLSSPTSPVAGARAPRAGATGASAAAAPLVAVAAGGPPSLPPARAPGGAPRAVMPPQVGGAVAGAPAEAGSRITGFPSLHPAAPWVGASAAAHAGTGAVGPSEGGGEGGAGSAPYGVTTARAARDSQAVALSRMRSQWESAGGVVVGEVHGHRLLPTPRSTASRASDSGSLSPRQRPYLAGAGSGGHSLKENGRAGYADVVAAGAGSTHGGSSGTSSSGRTPSRRNSASAAGDIAARVTGVAAGAPAARDAAADPELAVATRGAAPAGVGAARATITRSASGSSAGSGSGGHAAGPGPAARH